MPATPPKAVLIFDRNLETCLLGLDWLEEIPGLYTMSSRSPRSVDGRLGVYKLGIGAPMTSIAVEELVVQGAREFLILGTAGGIATSRPGGLVLYTKALRDEGVSHHYLPNSRYAVPDRGLVSGLREAMKKHGISFHSGPSWTIDAPYRESKRELTQYAKEGILTVEMEAAALFAVAKVVGARAAAVFMVSDMLTEDGWTGFVKGRRPQDFVRLARVAEVFWFLQPGKRYNRERTE